MLNLPQPGGVAAVETAPPWWQLPAGFVPGAPFHPALRIVTLEQIEARIKKLFNAGQQGAALALAAAASHALCYPHPPQLLVVQHIPELAKSPAALCQCPKCVAARGEAAV